MTVRLLAFTQKGMELARRLAAELSGEAARCGEGCTLDAWTADAFANAMLPEMAPYLERYPLLDKSVYSSFSIPKLREAAARADRVVVTGVVAECCVLSTVLAGIDLGHRMVYLTDAVAGVTPESEAQAEAIVSYLTVPHTEVLTTGAYLEQSR